MNEGCTQLQPFSSLACEKTQCLHIAILAALEHKHFLIQERQKDHRPQRFEIAKPVNQKAFLMKENEWIMCFHKYECVLGVYHCHKKKVLLALVSKRASEESSSD